MSTNYYACENEDQDYWEGLFLGKRAGGWVFQFKWHDWSYRNDKNTNHPYRNIDELEEFIEGKVIKNEYFETVEPEKFIKMTKEWCEDNDRVPTKPKRDIWEIDGYYFIKGNWC
jgi:hypothetical protein